MHLVSELLRRRARGSSGASATHARHGAASCGADGATYSEGLADLLALPGARAVPGVAQQGGGPAHYDRILHKYAVRHGLVSGELCGAAPGGLAPSGALQGEARAPITP